MGEIDNVTRERIREWQIRRLEIKEQIHLHPEKTLALSKILDLMDSEHADILSGLKSNRTVSAQQGATLKLTVPAVDSPPPVLGKFDLQLHVAARDLGDLRRLLEMAIYELQEKINTNETVAMNEHRKYPGGMSGTLGNYQFEPGIIGEASHE
ncbi:TPA: Lrp/AsnC ligand binding domain-containing protein [Pseudomonas aeruginosa]|uniref:Lrp/AsnC ligand binding domain-containing protein n=1 Tax=Pseudomonas aeruginosa TaxID=287 RepID=UPI001C3EB084|nr:Lrp/AsnC ligand binding domain-containing protein [Pseudomonas aeruginosa]MBV5799381.1 Lrp/AsnC ligand binding domain-containing protein [Pseudomonas aeruginosa]MCV3851746.1 Lrp/AsnC ligand binding domain-containing protein [Pseudomonas aeruginosa]MCV3857777.1 Lrp/AsnC ligand binding domain-containing protein [Pseudomonas aeruginosa]MDU0746606.1 Lrp/AsnC ligand binding domain-containing protein [Pseudomonas aeruginosa]MDU0758846.1 Lrp/AsnC ligand binding domain-containing protein [Pseudomon